VDTLTNVGTSYDAIPASQGLGGGRFNFTGVTQAKMDLRVNKVGTGTQSWQLWNETDAAEIGVINDAAAAGVKTLSATFSNLALTGEKIIRIRCKSSVAGDDPIFFYGSVLLT
jgi:hypothetical protein